MNWKQERKRRHAIIKHKKMFRKSMMELGDMLLEETRNSFAVLKFLKDK